MSREISVPVPRSLRPWVADVATVAGGESLVHLPDPATALVFRMTAAQGGDLMVVGPRTRAGYFAGKEFPFCLRMRLRPGAARPLVGVPVRELVDRVVPLADLWEGAAALTSRLASLAPDTRLVLAQLEAALPARIATGTTRDRARAGLVAGAAEALAVQPQPLPELARRLAVGERQLRELFVDGIGLAPKRFERITRVRDVLDRGRNRAVRWSQLATATGYYDQSHMTAEFRTMMGVPPAAFFAGRIPSPQFCSR